MQSVLVPSSSEKRVRRRQRLHLGLFRSLRFLFSGRTLAYAHTALVAISTGLCFCCIFCACVGFVHRPDIGFCRVSPFSPRLSCHVFSLFSLPAFHTLVAGTVGRVGRVSACAFSALVGTLPCICPSLLPVRCSLPLMVCLLCCLAAARCARVFTSLVMRFFRLVDFCRLLL